MQALNTLAALNPNIQNVMIDGALFQDEVNARQIMAVPSVYLNGEPFANGRMVHRGCHRQAGYRRRRTRRRQAGREGAV